MRLELLQKIFILAAAERVHGSRVRRIFQPATRQFDPA
jgi:hypothetical protein